MYNPEDARQYRNYILSVKSKSLPPLEEGVYYHEQIIGTSVYTTQGELIGIVDSILETGSNDVYVVKLDEREYLIPAIKDVIKEIDLKNRRILIDVIEGLLD